MKERIARLRDQIERIKVLAKSSDKQAAAELRSLALEMEGTVSEMEQRIGVSGSHPLN